MQLAIIIPIYNEAKIIKQSLAKVFELFPHEEIIIIDDGSTDNTLKILHKIKNKEKFELLVNKDNYGKGFSLTRGLAYVKSDWVVFLDADLEYDPNDILKIWEKIKASRQTSFAVFGSRFKNKPKEFKMYWLANLFLTKLTNLLFRSRLTDMETCIKFVPTTIIKRLDLSASGFEIEPQLTARLLKNKIKILEAPISYNRRNYQQGKKIKPKDGFIAVKTLFAEKLSR